MQHSRPLLQPALCKAALEEDLSFDEQDSHLQCRNSLDFSQLSIENANEIFQDDMRISSRRMSTLQRQSCTQSTSDPKRVSQGRYSTSQVTMGPSEKLVFIDELEEIIENENDGFVQVELLNSQTQTSSVPQVDAHSQTAGIESEAAGCQVNLIEQEPQQIQNCRNHRLQLTDLIKTLKEA